MKLTHCRRHTCCPVAIFASNALLLLPGIAQASLFQGETLDMVANIMSWVVLVIAPTVAIAVFWLVHIMPEKIAEKRQHPQAQAIKTLCLLSLFFGGLLWPLAWLWAYSKPVLYKLAYGTDRVAHGEDDAHEQTVPDVSRETRNEVARPLPEPGGIDEIEQLRLRIAALETRLAGTPTGN